MILLSKILFFTSHHGFYTVLILIALFGLVAYLTKKPLYLLPILPLSIANGFAGQFLNAWFLHKYGVRSTAIITSDVQTNSTLNDEYIHDYEAIVQLQDSTYVTTFFSTTSATIYPIENGIHIPQKGQRFPVKYIPGYEKNIVILYYESDDGARRLRFEKEAPVETARIKYEADPRNKTFIKEYIDALKAYTAVYNDASAAAYKQKIAELEQQLKDLDH